MKRQRVPRPQYLIALERRQRVFQLRQRGLSYRLIAEALWRDPLWAARLPRHYNARHAHQDIVRELARIHRDLDETASLVRELELQRLDQLQLGLWQRAMEGDTAAVSGVLAIMERRGRLLGLYQPLRVASVPSTGASTVAHAQADHPGDVEIADVARALAAHGQRLSDQRAFTEEGQTNCPLPTPSQKESDDDPNTARTSTN